MASPPRRVAVKLDLDWPYKRHAGVFAGLQAYAQARGWQCTVDEYVEDTLARHPRPLPYDGIVARATPLLARRAAGLNVPVVNVWASSPARGRLPGVFPDYAAMGRLRAEHLLSRGFRRFGTLTADDDRGQDEEVAAFTRAVADAGFPCAAARVALDTASSLAEWRKTERTITGWMDALAPPIGAYVGSESHGRIVAQACHRRGWRVPQDVAIVAGRNELTLCEGLRPTLSSVEVGYERVGAEAARLLDELMNGAPPPSQPILIPPAGLVVRESTDFFAVRDELVAAALQFIAANSHLPIGQDDVARAVAAETRTLQRRFGKHLNRGIAAEIRRVRIERARRELAMGDRSVKAIARDTGFGGSARLCEVFRRELGVTPSEYRRDRQVRLDGAITPQPR
ncbi:MAG TPA: substrate-binding domain-containing protein [Tepidisphaeraceae bacterium]|nr:substrate-binding domain-containing protein [Tepidisphaeraceae bacterium]